MSEPTCPALCCRVAGCFSNVGTYLPGTVLQGCGCISGVGTYLPGTVLQGCRLFKQCWSLPAGHCVAGVQTISAMSEPTCRALCCRVFKKCRNLPARHCVAGVQTV